MSEQRRHLRRALRVEFRCRDESGAGELVFASADVSEGGTFLVSDVLFERGEMLQLELDLPQGGTLRCAARVAWVRRFPERGQEAGMGVEFLALQEADQRALDSFLKGA
ncbi:MAG: PilZ domain-containing protein [Deltaproteobacteria bacterium]|nr:PilZ domain-containing protein [Deltaproteobacteria bacterium]